MNGLDLLLLVLLAVAGSSGYRRGLALQALSFGGLLVGLVAGALLAPVVAGLVESPAAEAAAAAVTLIALAGAGNAAGWLLGARLRERAHAKGLAHADAVGGSVTAVIASLLAIWFIALNLVNGPFTGVAEEIRGSAIVRTLNATLPEPPSLLSQVRQFFNRFGFPDVFTGAPPLPAAPVRPPTDEEARAAFEAAAGSTVRIVGEGCGYLQEGSGFVAAEGYIVTNAHVVAGVDEPHVQSPNRDQSATTVLFDPDLDLAVLLIPQSPGPALSFVDSDRGDAGALLGYPGGGALDARPAAVLRSFDAVGRDIYGRGEAERSVLELQAEVRPGNSGGPFVLANGTVGGVVFAASTTDDEVGYAIAASEVAPRVQEVVGTSREVDTGPCV
ncbi:MAG: MarP family serine protease [Actinomycetota bacterium]